MDFGMDFDDRLDEAHQAVLEMLPDGLLDLSDIPATRAMLTGLMEAMSADAPDIPDVDVEDHLAPGPEGDPEVMVRVYKPSGAEDALPGLLWIHGGGMVLGNVDMDDINCKAKVATIGCAVASVEYRLAPEHPHPAPVEDCFAALRWFVANAESLGVDPARIAVGGASAGGGLAAALALLARDRGVSVIYQHLIFPMLDDRNVTASSHYVRHPKVWNRDANIAGWTALLGKPAGSDDVSPYAAPARADDLSGLPPAFMIVGDLDLFLDEDVDYAMRLSRAGVPTEFHLMPGAIHGTNLFLPDAPVSKRWHTIEHQALSAALFG